MVKKKIIIIVLSLLVIGIAIYLSIFVFDIFKKENPSVVTQDVYEEYTCTRLSENKDGYSKMISTYYIKTKNDIANEITIYSEIEYSNTSSFNKAIETYQSDNSYEITGKDVEMNKLYLKQITSSNDSYYNYLKNNDIVEKQCSKKEDKKEDNIVKPSLYDKTITCKTEDSIVHLTVNSSNLITSIEKGIIRKASDFADYASIKKSATNTEYLYYIFDDENLTFTQMSKFVIDHDMDYDVYSNSNLEDYICEEE